MEVSAYHPFRSAEAKAEYLALYDEKAKSWPVTSECRMIDTSDGQTFVRISGPIDAPPLVLLPGGGATSLMWESNIESLSECYRAYAVDTLINTGCVGRSVYTRTIKSPDGAARWLDELFSTLELGNSINLIGMSYGGWLASQYALRLPDRLNGIVLLAPAATVLPLRLEFFIRGMLLRLAPLRYTYRSFSHWLFSDWAQQVSAQAIEVGVNESITVSRCFKPAEFPWPTVLTDEELQSIIVPALFLVGENERIYSAHKAVQRLNAVAPRIQTGVIPHAGHDLTFVQPEMVSQKIVEFLAQS
jgi:pimeloyl-ACP methyl ester carboxylesterase